MKELGEIAIVVGVAASAWALVGGLIGALLGRADISASARRGVWAATLGAFVGAAALITLLILHDYNIAYVWKYSSNTLETPYAVAALWAGQEGSLLLWVLVLGIYSSLAISMRRTEETGLLPHIVWVLGSVQFFFFLLLATSADPFATLVEAFPEAAGAVVTEGNGLNPQLQNYWMLIHPPILYFGYVGFAVPFAFAIAALATNRLDPNWIRASRVWTMTSWTFLGFGILLGGRWAYVELGWGGYWAWDPVENASLLPWLTGTAFIHSVIIEEQRGMLRRWNIFLILTTFLLSIFGTFLTRSGIIASVHSFAQSGVGDTFLWFMGAWAIVSFLLFSFRYDDLAPRRRFESILSRESAFLFQNLFLVAMAVAVLWGTMYPIFSRTFLGEEITVRAPYFNRAMIPIGLGLFFLIGAGPMIPWRAANWSRLGRNLGIPFVACITVLAGALHQTGNTYFALSWGIGVFILASTFIDLAVTALARARSTKENPIVAALNLIEKKRARYGGYLAHVGMALLLFGMAGNAFNVEREKYLLPGGEIAVPEANAIVKFLGAETGNDGHREFYRAEVEVRVAGGAAETFHPEISVYFPGTEREIRNSEVAIRSSISEDIYLVFAASEGENALIRVMVNPLVFLFWLGGLVMVFGALVALLPWKWPRFTDARPAPTAIVLILLISNFASAAQPTAGQYSHALGNRDPVSERFICQCSCNLVLAKCDMPNCGSASGLLDEIADLRSRGADDAAIVEEMVKSYGPKILGAPPSKGFHMLTWASPAILLGIGAIGLATFLYRGRAKTVGGDDGRVEAPITTEVEEALKRRKEEIK